MKSALSGGEGVFCVASQDIGNGKIRKCAVYENPAALMENQEKEDLLLANLTGGSEVKPAGGVFGLWCCNSGASAMI